VPARDRRVDRALRRGGDARGELVGRDWLRRRAPPSTPRSNSSASATGAGGVSARDLEERLVAERECAARAAEETEELRREAAEILGRSAWWQEELRRGRLQIRQTYERTTTMCSGRPRPRSRLMTGKRRPRGGGAG
jgi:hypothetical protein